ncbi:peroxiredoxin family protein [Sulfurirhabdus autotrophica]|nr:TlpA disulfide reductase family protein [Sulfurirhabdus autotrophica]
MLTRQTAVSSDSFTTLSGEKIRLQKLRGKIVLVTFWATSCPACIKEMPDLIQTYQKYHERGFEIIAVAMSYDSLQYVKAFTTKNKLPFSVVWDADGQLAKSFDGVRLTPTAFLIGKDGNLISQTIGIIDFSKFHAVLNSALLE